MSVIVERSELVPVSIGGQGYKVAFCQLRGLSPDSVPESVRLDMNYESALDLGTCIDGRDWYHINLIPKGEIKQDRKAALAVRVGQLNRDGQDALVVGNEETFETSDVLAVYSTAEGSQI